MISSNSVNKYIVKNLAPWMMDELLAFAKFNKFDVIFLRNQDVFYLENIKLLESKGIKIYKKPFALTHVFKKLWVIGVFLIKNIFNFSFNYNSVIGLKSIFWFLILDISTFSENSNIHAQFATQPTLVALLIKIYYRDKPKISFTFHAHDIYFKNNWFKTMVKTSENSFSISNYNINYVKDNYIQSDKIKLSRLGVFKEKNEINKHLSDKIFTIGLISWFNEKKGIIYLLQAVEIMRKEKVKNFKIKLAGDGPLKKEILAFIKDNDLFDNVEYLGKLNDIEKRSFFSSIDAFILPSIRLKNDQDGIPVVLMEAISYGLPIISTDISGIPEICINEYNGFLIEEKNVQQIVDSIKKMIKDETLRKYFSKNALILSDEYDIMKNSCNKLKELKWL